MSKRESRSEPGNAKPISRLGDKFRWKRKDKTVVETDLQPSADDERPKSPKPQTLTQVPLETSDPGSSADPGHSEIRRNSLLQGNDDQAHDVVLDNDSSQPENLWKNAYEALKARDRDLVEVYTLSLAALNDIEINCPQTSVPDLTPNEINIVVKKRLDYLETKQLMIHLRGKPIKVREQGEKVIKFILWSNGFISTALSTQPYAALAWSGVSILLPLFLNSSQQSKDMLDGLDSICDLLELYRLKESVYLQHRDSPVHQDCVKAVEKLYTDIFEYQAQLICFLSKSSIKRAIRGTFQLDDWKKMLEKVKGSDKQCIEHFKLFNDDKNQQFISQNLCSWKQSIEIYERMVEMGESSQIREQLNRQDDHETDLLRTLSPPESDYKRDKNVISARVAGTCKWFFEDERFLNWRDSKSPELLWVSAGPGCGKSVLARALIDERRVCTNVMASTVCYFFFKDGQQKRMDGASALCAILHQLFRNTPNLIMHGLPSHRSYGDNLKNKFSELWEILIKAAEDPEAGEIVCILDALDECEHKEREELIRELVSFFSRTDTHRNRSFPLKFLVTSRHYGDIEGNFEPLFEVSTFIRFDGNDKLHVIAEEINLVIDAKIPEIAKHFTAEQRESIRRRLKEMNNRTYLWLFLTIDIIKGSRSQYSKKSSIDKLLLNLPSRISDAYERILDRSSDKDLARILLRLIVATTRPLSLKEANVALTLASQEPPPRSYKEVDLWPLARFESIVQDICGLFVSVHDGKLYLIHQTAKEFLIGTSGAHSAESGNLGKWQGCFDTTEAHGTISKVCLRYLNFDDLAIRDKYERIYGSEGEDDSDVDEFQYEVRSSSLFDYAARNWPEHYTLQSSKDAKDSRESAKMLCNRGASGAYWLEQYDELRRGMALGVSREMRRTRHSTSLGVASLLGLVDVVEELLTEGADVNAEDAYHGSALKAASYRCHYQVVQVLLENGADINAQGDPHGGALHAAASVPHYRMVQMLLEKGADANPHVRDYNNPLQIAADQGFHEVVQLLLEKGADIDAPASYGGNALQLAAMMGHCQVVQLLLDKGANINAQVGHFDTAIQAAAWSGERQVVQILLERGADINAQSRSGSNALQAASEQGRYEVVQLLLEKGADVNAHGGPYSNALRAATTKGGHERRYDTGRLNFDYDEVTLMLLKGGANLESANLDEHRLRRLQGLLKRENDLEQADLSEYLHRVEKLLETANRLKIPQELQELLERAKTTESLQEFQEFRKRANLKAQDGLSTSSA